MPQLTFAPLTLFPEMFDTITQEGVIARAIAQNLIAVAPIFLREFAPTPHRHVDAPPAGGGDGMVIRADIADAAIASIHKPQSHVIHLSPTGKVFSAARARDLAKKEHIILLCGRYAGFDQRVVDKYAHEEISLGDFVLSGGELPALCLIDAIARFVPGVLGNPESKDADSFEDGLLEAPIYTKPNVFEGHEIPAVMLSGDHTAVSKYRRREQLKRTARNRPDLIQALWDTLTRSEKSLVERIWKQG